MRFYKEKIFIIIIFLSAVFSVFFFFNGSASAQECDVDKIVFTPSSGEIDGDTWFNRGNPPNFKITIAGNNKCGGQTLQDVSLTNKAGPNNDMEALNDQPVTFNPGSNRIELTFQAGEEGCWSTPDPLGIADDCHLELQLTTSTGTFWSTTISGNYGILEYDCDRRYDTCIGGHEFKLLGVTGGRVGVPTVQDSICAYIDPGNKKYACIPNSNQKAAENRCAEVQGCQGKNCSVINPSFCGQDSGGGGPQPPAPGATVSFKFELTNPIQAESLIDLVKAIAKFIFQIAIPIAVILIIWVGIMFLKSGGEPTKIKQAKLALFYIIIGLVIIFIGQGFVALIKSILDLGK